MPFVLQAQRVAAKQAAKVYAVEEATGLTNNPGTVHVGSPTTSEDVQAKPTMSRRSSMERTTEKLQQIQSESKTDETLPEVKKQFNYGVGVVILINVCIMALQTDYDDPEEEASKRWGWILIDGVFLIFYICEIGVRIYWEHSRWILSPWNWFDLLIVLFAFIDVCVLSFVVKKLGSLQMLSALRVVRFVKLTRMIKIARFIEPMYIMIIAFWNSLKQIATLGSMILFGITIYAIFGVHWIGKNSAFEDLVIDGWSVYERFGTVPRSMWSLIEIMTLEGWVFVARPLVEREPSVVIFLTSFIGIFTFGLLNMVVAIVVSKTLEQTKKLTEKKQTTTTQAMLDEIVRMQTTFQEDVIKKADSGDGKDFLARGVKLKDFVTCLEHSQKMRDILEELGIPLCELPDVFNILDEDHDGHLTVEEFVEGCIKLTADTPAAWDVLATRASVSGLSIHVSGLTKRLDEVSGRMDQQELVLKEILKRLPVPALQMEDTIMG